MTLRIKNVTAKNFMSIGAQTQAVNFDTGQLTLVLGHNLDLGGEGSRNGTGKTTIINALSYALYGEALTNIKKDHLINKTNGKHMLVTVDFEIDGTEYRIERGRKPQIMRFLINGNESKDDDAQGENKETQKQIEGILGFPHNMFKHLIALNTYSEPFLSMRANDQREMIEQLLGITDLSTKADLLKEKLKKTKDNIKEEEFRINAVQESNKRIEQNIREIERRGSAWTKSHTSKIKDLEDSIQVLAELDVDAEIAAHKHNAEVAEHTANKLAQEKAMSTLSKSFERAQKRYQDHEADLTSALEGTCPSCGQDTAHLSTHEEYIKGVKEKMANEKEHMDQIFAEMEKTGVDVTEPADTLDTFYDDVEQAYEHRANLDNLATQYSSKLEETNPYTEQVASLRKTGLQEIDFEQMNEMDKLREHQDFLLKLLTSKDSFIRKRIIDQNISYLNHRLAYYLEKIGLPHAVKFGSDLDVEITEYGRDLSFDNLSRGERNRLILSMSWAFRDIYESLNHSMNLMCIDELIDSGMDTIGAESALAILKKMNRDQGKNILLISHKEELIGRVNNVLTVIKSNGFTEYSTDTEILDKT
jgi:DNA repair exonuclease SbcCD ATPase subunit